MPCAIYRAGPILPPYVATIGENLKKLRGRASLQQGEVAEKVGVPQSQLSRWETDTAVPDTASLLRIAPALEATLDEIMAGVDAAYDSVLRRRGDLSRSAVALEGSSALMPVRTIELDNSDGPRDFALVPMLARRIAAGEPLVVTDHDIDDYIAVPKALIAQLRVAKPYFVRVGPDQRSMLGTIQPGATVLLDCSDAKRERPINGRIYAVNFAGGSSLKRVTVAGGVVYLSSDNLDKVEYPLIEISSDDDHAEITTIIVGQAVLNWNVLL